MNHEIIISFLLGFAVTATIVLRLWQLRARKHHKELNEANDKGWCDGYFKAVAVYTPRRPHRDKRGRFAAKPSLADPAPVTLPAKPYIR